MTSTCESGDVESGSMFVVLSREVSRPPELKATPELC
jgi:hypothetical protein